MFDFKKICSKCQINEISFTFESSEVAFKIVIFMLTSLQILINGEVI